MLDLLSVEKGTITQKYRQTHEAREMLEKHDKQKIRQR
jgi:hypothetical protein